MSDVSLGPGWWLASDHRWYPPESHPAYRPVPDGPPLAPYGLRVGGWLIDWLILLAVCIPLSAVTHSFHYSHVVINAPSGSSTSTNFSSNNTSFNWGLPGALLSPLIVVVYGTLMCGSKRAQTLGMMAMGTKAVKLSTGEPIGYAVALGRALFEELLAALLFLPWVLDMLFPIWDRKNQTLHDKVSGTIVVKASRS